MNTVDTTEARHPLDLPHEDPTLALAGALMPLTVLGLAERVVLHYGDHIAYVNGTWRVADQPGEWDRADEATALAYVSTAALAVVRSLSTVEHKAIGHYTGPGGGYNAAIRHRAAAQRFEDMKDIAERILGHARHLVAHEEFTEV